MVHVMRVVAHLAQDDYRELASRISDSCVLRAVASIEELTTIIKKSEADLVVTTLRDHIDNTVPSALTSLVGRIAIPQLILHVQLRQSDVNLLVDTIRLAPEVDVALKGYDALYLTVSRAINRANDLGRARLVVLSRLSRLEASQRQFVVCASILLALTRPTIDDMAQMCGVSKRSLERMAAIGGLPPPRELLSSACCVQTVWLLEIAGWPAKQVAAAAGFASVQALTHFVQRHTGHPPKRLIRHVGYRSLLDAWASSISTTSPTR